MRRIPDHKMSVQSDGVYYCWICKYGNNPCKPPSRPNPLSLYPPNGDVGSNLLYVFAHTTPARSLVVRLKIFEPLSVHTPAESPYGILFAFSTASSTVRNV